MTSVRQVLTVRTVTMAMTDLLENQAKTEKTPIQERDQSHRSLALLVPMHPEGHLAVPDRRAPTATLDLMATTPREANVEILDRPVLLEALETMEHPETRFVSVSWYIYGFPLKRSISLLKNVTNTKY